VDVYSRVGILREVFTDQGGHFTSELMREVSCLLSYVNLQRSSGAFQCSGGCVQSGREFINALLFAYREVPQENFGFSPFEMLYSRMVRGLMLILLELWAKQFPDSEVKTTYQYVVDLKEKLEETCGLAHEQLKASQCQQAKYF